MVSTSVCHQDQSGSHVHSLCYATLYYLFASLKDVARETFSFLACAPSKFPTSLCFLVIVVIKLVKLVATALLSLLDLLSEMKI